MKRREIVKNLALAGTTSLLTKLTSKQVLSQNAVDSANPVIEWRMATSWPETLDIIMGALQLFTERVSVLTNNRFKITVFPAGGIAPPLEILDVVSAGSTECGHTAGYYYVSKNPALAFATVVPFGLPTFQHLTWIQSGGGLDITRKLYGDYNVINFLIGNTGIQMGGWFKKKVNTVADLKGLKMRMPGLGGKIVKKLGIEAQNLPPAEIVPALERGGVEAAEWNHPYDDEKLGLNKVAPYYYYPGWHEPGANYELLINKNAWEKLPLSYQQAIETAAREAHLFAIAKYDAENRLALQRLQQFGTEFLPFSEEILTAAKKATFEFYKEQAAESPDFAQVYEPWNRFRENLSQWNRINEVSFSNFLASKFN